MADLSGFLGNFGGFGGIIQNVVYSLLAIMALGMAIGILYFTVYKKRRWNLNVEIKIPRSDGRLMIAEWGKGAYDENKGVVLIKRTRKKAVAMKPFDTKRFIQGEKILTVVQLSPGHYVPVLPESFHEMVDDNDETKISSWANVRSDLSESKSWKNSFERDAKEAYSILSLLEKYAPYIGIGVILFMNFAGFAILYSKVA